VSTTLADAVLMPRETVERSERGATSGPEEPVRMAAAARERILIAIRPDDRAAHLIRVGKRIADQCGADWTVVCVQTPAFVRAGSGALDCLAAAFRLAESLGGETVSIDGASAGASLAQYAHVRQASQIVVGARRRRGLRRFARRDVANLLIELAASAQVIVVKSGKGGQTPPGSAAPVARPTARVPAGDPLIAWSLYLRALGITALCTAIAYPLYPQFDPVNIVMVYLLGTTLAALRLGRGPSAVSAIGNVAAFDFFFVPPRYSFYIAETQYLFTLGVILGVTLVIANLMVSVRRQTESAAARERRTATLYAMSRELSVAPDAAAIAGVAARHVAAAIEGRAVVLLADDQGSLREAAQFGRTGESVDLPVAQRALASGQIPGPGMQDHAESPSLYLPLSGGERPNGVLVVQPLEVRSLLPEQQRLLETLAGQIALALERARLAELAAASRAAAERAALRNTLLASISHDLRAPLSAIAGAGSLVAQANDSLDRHRRTTLGQLIEEKARDMSELLSNILELMRLETARGPVKADWQSLEELVGTAVRCNEHRLDRWRVITAIPADLPLVFLDGQLIVQVLSNLLENASKHTPPGTSITVGAMVRADKILLTVEDDGPGFGARDPERLFEKFERGQEESHISGVGLGLAICRAITVLHGGEIRAMNRPTGGARFEITLPLTSAQHPQEVEHS
jgi:two-component system, OmpR family, sensor histidine kinase KdpD